jgi:hypothetical protein
MSRKVSQVDDITSAEDEIDESLVTTAPDDWEFEVVAEESPIRAIFENFGDTFIGQYQGIQHVVPKNEGDDPFDLFLFRARDERLYAVNTSFKLIEAMEGVDEGTWVKLEYVKDIPTGRKLQPMKDFRVSIRK